MKVERFFEKFEMLAETPGAVRRLRQLILAWAVEGKLVAQVSTDEHASCLLHRTIQARRKLLSLGPGRDSSADLRNAQEAGSRLPSGWARAPLSDYAAVIMGQSPPSSAYNETGRGLPFYQGKAQFGKLFPTATTWCNEPRKTGEPGDIVISVRAPVGPTNVLQERSCIGRGLAAIRSLGGNQRHLLYTLRAVERDIAALGVGSTFPAISRRDLDTFSLLIPPLPEQARIVAKVDELMALCDQLEAQQRERQSRHVVLASASLARFSEDPTPAKLEFLFHKSYDIEPIELKKAVLTLAVEGKLVLQDRSDESAQKYLERLRRGRARPKYENKTTANQAHECTQQDSGRFVLPASWCWTQLGDLADLVTSGSRDWARYYSTDGAVFVRMGNLSRGTYRLRLDKLQRVKPPKDAEGDRTRLEPNDLLVSITGEVGLLGLIPQGFGEAYINQHTCLVRLPAELHSRFIAEYFRSPFAQRYFGGPQRGLKNSFRLSDVTEMPVPVPPLPEQRRIVAKVDELMARIDQLEAQLAASRATGERLLEAIVSDLTEGGWAA